MINFIMGLFGFGQVEKVEVPVQLFPALFREQGEESWDEIPYSTEVDWNSGNTCPGHICPEQEVTSRF